MLFSLSVCECRGPLMSMARKSHGRLPRARIHHPPPMWPLLRAAGVDIHGMGVGHWQPAFSTFPWVAGLEHLLGPVPAFRRPGAGAVGQKASLPERFFRRRGPIQGPGSTISGARHDHQGKKKKKKDEKKKTRFLEKPYIGPRYYIRVSFSEERGPRCGFAGPNCRNAEAVKKKGRDGTST